MSEFSQRVLFAVVAIPLTVLILYLGGPTLVTLIAALSGVAAWEFYRLSRASGAESFEATGVFIVMLLPLALYARELGLIRVPLTLGVVVAMALLAAAIWARGPGRKPMLTVTVTVFGVIYAGVLSYLYALRYHQYAVGASAGLALVMLPLVVTWATDIGAYFAGRFFGKSLLIPSISPKKTWVGAVGGLVLAVVASLLYVRGVLTPVARLSMTPSAMVAFGVLSSVAAQIGDIAESLLKREANVKDSSSIFPGHGGVLDRFDSLLFVLPLTYLLLALWLVPVP